MQQKGLSIIVPTLNESANLKNLLQHLLEIGNKLSLSFEIIIVDDHSTDDSRQIVQTYRKKYPIKFILKTAKRGRGYSILQGFSASKYSYIAIIDGDTYAPELLHYFPKLSALAVEHGFAYISHGPQIFCREIFSLLNSHRVSAWFIDQALIDTGHALGYPGTKLNLVLTHFHRAKPFTERLKRRLEKLAGFWRLRFKADAIALPSSGNHAMLGAGVIYHKKRFITHTTLPSHLSALSTFTAWQFLLVTGLILLFAFGLAVSPQLTLIMVTTILSIVYLIDVIFNLIVTLKSLHFPPEISFSRQKVKALRDSELPVYSILCPLYKESKVLPQFVAAMKGLEWPKAKLDVILLLEEGDETTIKKAKQLKLPSFIRTLIVPHSYPKTKPKACNYGLAHAKGEYVVIYDAEDLPDPYQLKKAYLGFRSAKPNIACLQAKLNYYNPHQNLLTRLFTAEYSLWFDIILPGLQSINTSIPLGGTSNHFKTKVLRELKGWDPFNVTEDADLGSRLFGAGYQTAIIDSTTLEEANSNVRNWFRQRSRWLKGYMQTYLVHMRNPVKLVRKQGVHALIFNLVVGGKIAFILINPFLWLMTISYFVLYSRVGPAIESIYPAPVFYTAAFSLLVGNFVSLYNYMIGTAKREHWDLLKHIYLIPFYWLAISCAAVMAVFQLIVKPHYWEKTIHGLHLQEKQAAKTAAGSLSFQTLSNKLSRSFTAGGSVVIAGLLGNFLNFLYSAFLARRVSLEEFGSLNLFSSLLLFTQVPIGSLGNAVTHRIAYLLGRYRTPAKNLWLSFRKQSRSVAFAGTLLYLLSIPVLRQFFSIHSYLPFLLFTPVILIGTLANVDAGFLGGILSFTKLAVLIVIEAAAKLILTIILIRFGRADLVYAALPLSMLFSFTIGYYLVRKIDSHEQVQYQKEETSFPTKFWYSSIITALTVLFYTNLDLILSKHYLSPSAAGTYSYLSLVGKMVFLASSMFGNFVIPYVSRDLGEGKEAKIIFHRIAFMVVGVSLLAFIVFGLFGSVTAPLLWGDRVLAIMPYVIPYSLAMVAYSLSAIYVRYHLVKGENVFAYLGFTVGILQVFAIILHHHGISDIVESVTVASIVSLTLTLLLSYFYSRFTDSYHAFLDLIGLFQPIPPLPPLDSGSLRILIFNWRDTKHVWAGGAEKYLYELSRRWVKNGHQVTVFCGNDGKNQRYDVVDGIHVIRRGGFYLVYFWAFWYYLFQLRGKYDLIIDSENGLPFFTPLYAKEKTYLLIHHVHQEVFQNSLRPPFSWLAEFLEKKVMPWVYRNTEVITVSPSSKSEILAHQLTRKDPHVIYNGIDSSLYRPGEKSKTPLVLYLGRLTMAKSIHVLIHSVAMLKTKIPRLHVVIAGDGPAKNDLLNLTFKLGLKDLISFVGRVTDEEKIDYYRKAWVFVNPSLIEGWGITTIEANACGTPVVASNVAGLQDAVSNPHSGFLVPYGNVGEFSSAISKILKNKKIRERMSKDSILWASKFDWDASAAQALSILKGDK